MRLLFSITLFIISAMPSSASAQTSDNPWTIPQNLSHSGVAVNPAIVVDSDSVVHAIWQDDSADFISTRQDGDGWLTPKLTYLNRLFDMPTAIERTGTPTTIYSGQNPMFVPGPSGFIFSFWLSPQGKLFTSRVRNQNFENVAAWDSAHLITPEVASFTATIDAQGEWHLAFIRVLDDPADPAGIYYIHSTFNGGNWTLPVLLYESPYLRTLVEGDDNLSITTTGSEDTLQVYLAWDNRPRKQVLFSRSLDGGASWDEPTVIAGPSPDFGFTTPFNIQVGTAQDNVVLVWQSGQPGDACSQIYQSSSDAGVTWSEQELMIVDLLGCAYSNEFVTRLGNNSEGPLYFLTKTKSKVFLTAWDEHQWSQPQEQLLLSGFEEPEIFTEVIYGCHRASLSGEQLFIIGCDEGGGGDVWVTSRDMGSNTSSFEPPVWSQLLPITNDSLAVDAVEVVATNDGLFHAFFNQHQDPAIYYTYLNGELWSRTTSVMTLPDGKAGWPASSVGPANELFLIATNNNGVLYFSRATSGNTATESNWSTPTRLETIHDGAIGSVDVAWDATGTVYVTYSVPVNDKRGIYLVLSKDQGTTWSESVQVFDGAATDIDFVGAPSFLITDNGSLHIVWKVQSIQGDGVPQPLSLYYAQSQNGGRTFSTPEMVVDEPVIWQDIVMDGEGNLHLLWKPQDTVTTAWDQISFDDGKTWQYPQGLLDGGKLAAVTRDPAGRLNLVSTGPSTLDHWLWNGNSWQSEDPPGWLFSSQQEARLLATDVNKQGKMMVILARPMNAEDTTQMSLLYATRTLKLPLNPGPGPKVPTPTLLPSTMIPSTPTHESVPIPTGTIESASSTSQVQMDPNEPNNRLSPFTMAIVPVVLLLLSILGIVIWQTNRDKTSSSS